MNVSLHINWIKRGAQLKQTDTGVVCRRVKIVLRAFAVTMVTGYCPQLVWCPILYAFVKFTQDMSYNRSRILLNDVGKTPTSGSRRVDAVSPK